MSIFSLAGKHALVTGATGDLGRAAAVALAEAGAIVSVTTTRVDRTEEVTSHSILNECWSAAGSNGQQHTLDLTDAASVEAAVERMERDHGPIAILVNATHHANIKPALEATVEEWTRELARNATTAFVATQAVGRRMVARGHGRVITIVSDLHDRGAPNSALFGASQAALVGMTKSLALEWGHGPALAAERVTVNAIGIGFIEGVAGPHADAAVAEAMRRYIPLRRLGTPRDIGGALVYLAGDQANYLNGEIVVVDGAIANHA